MVLFAVAALAVPAAAQPRVCEVVLDESGMMAMKEVRPGVTNLFGGGGVLSHCKDDPTRMKSDSFAYYAETERVDLVGKVRFTDSMVTLDANRATYFLRDERLEAYQNVVLVNRKTGSKLSGPNLIYRRRAPGIRDTTELYATQHPKVEYRPESEGPRAEPYIINSDRVRLVGNDRAWSGGNVTIDRSDFFAKGDSALLDMAAGQGELVNHAGLEGRGGAKYTLTGRYIQYHMQERKLTWVQARGAAEALSAEWRLLADTVEFDVANNQIQGGRAWTDTARARAISTTYTILADSLAIDAPGQRLTELRGFRRATATSLPDSTRTESDWMSGDTLLARFDTTALGQRILSRLTAHGNAKAFYHVPDPDRPAGPPGVSYSRGQRIAARFTLVGLDRVDIVGQSDGLYLAPGAPVPADSTAKPPPPVVTPALPPRTRT